MRIRELLFRFSDCCCCGGDCVFVCLCFLCLLFLFVSDFRLTICFFCFVLFLSSFLLFSLPFLFFSDNLGFWNFLLQKVKECIDNVISIILLNQRVYRQCHIYNTTESAVSLKCKKLRSTILTSLQEDLKSGTGMWISDWNSFVEVLLYHRLYFQNSDKECCRPTIQCNIYDWGLRMVGFI